MLPPYFGSIAFDPLFAKLNLMLGIFMVAEGVIFAIVALILFRKKSAQLLRCQRTRGEVVEVKEHYSGEAPTKHPVIRYKTSAGAVHTFESKYGRSDWNIKTGDTLEILVNKDDPRQAEVAHWVAQWGLPMFLGLLAILSIIAAPIVFFVLSR